MTRVFRVLREAYARAPFDGEGAYRYGGRWSNPGTRLVYTSEHQSLAMLEYFVHLDPEDAPNDLVLATRTFPTTCRGNNFIPASCRPIGGRRPRLPSSPRLAMSS